jgi:hypothetical protein
MAESFLDAAAEYLQFFDKWGPAFTASCIDEVPPNPAEPDEVGPVVDEVEPAADDDEVVFEPPRAKARLAPPCPWRASVAPPSPDGTVQSPATPPAISVATAKSPPIVRAASSSSASWQQDWQPQVPYEPTTSASHDQWYAWPGWDADSWRASQEETEHAKQNDIRWQDRGPLPQHENERWRQQRWRPGTERWGNRGGSRRGWYGVYYAALKAGASKVDAASLADAQCPQEQR